MPEKEPEQNSKGPKTPASVSASLSLSLSFSHTHSQSQILVNHGTYLDGSAAGHHLWASNRLSIQPEPRPRLWS